MICEICGRPHAELHHIIFRSEVKPLEKCKLNHVYLCYEHHRGTMGVHGRLGNELNKSLRLKFQNTLEMLFNKNEFTIEEIADILSIHLKQAIKLSKSFNKIMSINRTYQREDIIRACMGGKIIIVEG